MKFYSDITKELYDTFEACEAAEAAYTKAEEEKKNGKSVALAQLEKLYAEYQCETENYTKAQTRLSTSTKAMKAAVSNFIKTYGYLPDKYRTFQILTWLL